MSELSDALKPLPNKELQIKRVINRRVFPCPSCGKNVIGCYAKRPVKKPLEHADIVVPCPDCGTFTILTNLKKGEPVMTVKETGASYDRFSRVTAAMKEAGKWKAETKGAKMDPEWYIGAADSRSRLARELQIADPNNEMLPRLFKLAIDCECGAIEGGRLERIEGLARLMNDCDDLSQYDLLMARANAFEMISSHRDLLAPALFIKLEIEDVLVSSAFNSIDMDDDPEFTDMEFDEYIRDFDALSKEEKSVYPYAAADGYIYSINTALRLGRKGNEFSKKLITAIRKARKNGAPEERRYMLSLLQAYSRVMTKKNGMAEKMLEDAKLWSDPLYGAIADYILADHIVSEHTDLFGSVDPEEMTYEERSEAVSRINDALEVMETIDDVSGFAWRIADSYAIRGILTGSKDDLNLAADYLYFFSFIGKMEPETAHHIAFRITTNTRIGSPVQKKVLSMMGYPVF